MSMSKTFYLIILGIFTTSIGFSQNDSIHIERTSDFELDGKGLSQNWDKAAWVSLQYSGEGNEPYITQSKILYSETGVYFLFHCQDNIINSTMTEDFDNLWEEDVVEVFFWTHEDYPFYFEYELSPSNYELPILVPNVKGDFLGWTPWNYEGDRRTKHATYIHENEGEIKYWTAEFFIPYKLLKPMANVPPQPGTRWRANMYRLDHDNGTSAWFWQPIRTNFHDYEMYGTFIFK